MGRRLKSYLRGGESFIPRTNFKLFFLRDGLSYDGSAGADGNTVKPRLSTIDENLKEELWGPEALNLPPLMTTEVWRACRLMSRHEQKKFDKFKQGVRELETNHNSVLSS